MNLSSMADFFRLNKYSYKTFSKTPETNEKSVPVHCPICYKSSVAVHWDCGDYIFSRCVGCGHIYQNPMPASDDLLNRYDEEYKEYEVENGDNFFNLMRFGLRDAGLFSLERRLPDTKRMIDIGCATGVLVKYMQDRGWDSEGLEVCKPAALYGIEERGVRIHIATLSDAGLQNDYYDFVHFSHVIEHLPEINDFLAEVRRIVKPGGYVSITTPNRVSLQAILMGSRWRSAIADHTHLFSPRDLKILLKRHGFHLVKSQTWGGIPVGMANSRLKKSIDRIARISGFGDVVMVMAQRVT